MPFTNSPNMSLPVPTVGAEPGPNYATDVNNSLNIIDGHTHAPGSGVPITPSAMNINTSLAFNGNFATNIAGLVLSAQGSTPDVNTLYESGVDLFYVDGNGNNIQITANGGIAGSPGSISNLNPPASASYVAGSSTFVWQSDTSIAANMDFGAAIMRNLSPNSTFALTLQPPAALSINVTLTLPLPPASSSFMTMDSTGAMAVPIAVSGGITASNIANGTITTTQISSSAGILGTQLSASADILLSQLDAAVTQWNSQTFTTSYLTFTLSTTHNTTAGATYTHNGFTFTVINTIVSSNSVLMSTNGPPLASGTLTKASGTGDASMAFTSYVATSNENFTVPTNVNQVYVWAAGGGGGGAAGGAAGGTAGEVGGGGGGGGMPYLTPVPVTPGQVIPITVGIGGIPGVGVHNSDGGNGTAGSKTLFGSLATFPGGNPGRNGIGSGAGGFTTWFCNSGGDGGATGGNAGVAGVNSMYASGGAGGAVSAGLSGGGGGGAGFGAGADGKIGNTVVAANSAAVNSSGGGGGGSSVPSGNAGGNGGSGGSGKLIVYWIGHP